MKIYYVGTKPDGETAFSPITGITWMPGDSHDIADEKIAIRMLQHPDVFSKAPPALIEAQAAVNTAPAAGGLSSALNVQVAALTSAPAPVASPAPTPAPAPVSEADNLASLSREELHALAKDRGVVVHHAAGAEKVRAALIEAQAKP